MDHSDEELGRATGRTSLSLLEDASRPITMIERKAVVNELLALTAERDELLRHRDQHTRRVNALLWQVRRLFVGNTPEERRGAAHRAQEILAELIAQDEE